MGTFSQEQISKQYHQKRQKQKLEKSKKVFLVRKKENIVPCSYKYFKYILR